MEEIRNYIIYQVGALQGFAKAAGISLQHVKPHGALYNTARKDADISRAIAEAVKTLNPKLIVFAPPKSELAKAVAKAGLRVAHEVFADRAYNSDGSLVSRKQPSALIKEPQQVVERVVKMVKEGTVTAANGETVKLGEVHTICVHGDTPTAVELVKNLKKGLIKAGINVKPASSFV
jgi:UPF0271 protein